MASEAEFRSSNLFLRIDVSAAAERMMENRKAERRRPSKKPSDVLKELVAQAIASGVNAGMEVRFGKSWLELIRQVLRNEHDLVVAGTR